MHDTPDSSEANTLHVITVPLDRVTDRRTPLVLRGEFSEDGDLRLRILGDFSFRNVVGELPYKDHLVRLGTPTALKTARTIETPPFSRRERIKRLVGNLLTP